MATGTMLVEAEVLDIEHRHGDFTPDGEDKAIAYDFHAVFVLLGRETYQLRWKPTPELPLPRKGDKLLVEVFVPKGTRITVKADLSEVRELASV